MADQRRADETRQVLAGLDASAAEYATQFVDVLLTAARQLGVSDVHLQPCPEGLDTRWRLDGVLQPVGRFRRGAKSDVIAQAQSPGRTADLPERRPARGPYSRHRAGGRDASQHLSDAARRTGRRPVIRGGRAATCTSKTWDCRPKWRRRWAACWSRPRGPFVVSGPAGTGKTTTVYACLREIVPRLQRAEVRRLARRPDRNASGRRGPIASQRGRGIHV